MNTIPSNCRLYEASRAMKASAVTSSVSSAGGFSILSAVMKAVKHGGRQQRGRQTWWPPTTRPSKKFGDCQTTSRPTWAPTTWGCHTEAPTWRPPTWRPPTQRLPTWRLPCRQHGGRRQGNRHRDDQKCSLLPGLQVMNSRSLFQCYENPTLNSNYLKDLTQVISS
jgi:hypothetical protein